jgi:hypothetical protein
VTVEHNGKEYTSGIQYVTGATPPDENNVIERQMIAPEPGVHTYEVETDLVDSELFAVIHKLLSSAEQVGISTEGAVTPMEEWVTRQLTVKEYMTADKIESCRGSESSVLRSILAGEAIC